MSRKTQEKSAPDVARSLPRGLKKIYYEVRGIGARTIIAILIIGGLLLPLCYSARLIYLEAASAKAGVNLYYEEIADAQYPDKSRFTYYDLVDTDRIAEALAIVQKEYGIYENFTAEELEKAFFVYSKLDSAVRDNVEYSRSQGADYSYVANEYNVVYIQPHDYNDPNILRRFFPKNNSELFLTTLMEVNYNYFVYGVGGPGGFSRLSDIGDSSIYDYGELVDLYTSRIQSMILALYDIDEVTDGYLSTSHDRKVRDLVGEYKLLRSDLSSIKNFIESSGLTRDLEVLLNKLNTNLDDNLFRFNNSSDAYVINKQAQESYDHTFTENLIVVALDKYSDRLYQARPKTAFDSVTVQKEESMEDRAKYRSRVEDTKMRLERYNSTTGTKAEYERLCAKCEELIDKFETDYGALTARAYEIITEAYSAANRGFLSYKVKPRSILTTDFLIKNCSLCAIGVACAFVICVAINSWGEVNKRRRREKILLKLKKDANVRREEV